MSDSYGSSSSSSTSKSFIPDYPQSGFLMQVAQLAEQLGQQQYGWATNQYANSSALTDQVVNNFLTASQQDMDLANNMTNRYENVFQPQEDALVRDANTYASSARVNSEMGRAESDTGQAMDSAKRNAEQTLQSYGIDPSSGRYAELDRAQDAQRAAAQAQAGQAARYNTEATGRQLRGQAIQVGQQYPGQIVNSLNNAMQGFAGAENAKLSNINTGVNAFNSSKGFLDTASSLKYPPLGNNGQSQSSSNQQSHSQPKPSSDSSASRSSGSPSPAFGGATPSPFDSFAMNHGGAGNGANDGSNFGGGGGGFGGSIARTINTGYDDTGFGGESGVGSTDETGFQDAYGPQNMYGDFYNSSDYGSMGSYGDSGYGGSSPADSFYGDAYGAADSSYGSDANTNNYGTDSFASGYSDYGTQDNTSSDYYGDAGGYDYGGGDFAAGGAIPDGSDQGPTTGGFVPPQASPSMGQQTDDVNAHVNVGEFVIPRDVALWKGQEFFQNLIEKSRKARGAAPAKGKPSNRPTNGPPSFVSHAG